MLDGRTCGDVIRPNDPGRIAFVVDTARVPYRLPFAAIDAPAKRFEIDDLGAVIGENLSLLERIIVAP